MHPGDSKTTLALWQTCDDPCRMLSFQLGEQINWQRLRFLFCACCRLHNRQIKNYRLSDHHWIPDHGVLDVCESHTNKEIPRLDMETAKAARKTALSGYWPSDTFWDVFDYPSGIMIEHVKNGLIWLLNGYGQADYLLLRREQADLCREILGNPFERGTEIWPTEWFTDTSSWLAGAIYQHRNRSTGLLDPERLLILADCLDELGCTDEDALRHLRGQQWCYQCFGGPGWPTCSMCNPRRLSYDNWSGWVSSRTQHYLGCWVIEKFRPEFEKRQW